jgi:hypothetical protein
MALADILKQSELDALYADNVSGSISPADLRKLVSSIAPYGGVMRTAPIVDYAVPDTPAALDFDSYNIPGNDLMTFDLVNNKCVINAGGIYYVTWRLSGEWAATDDVDLHVYLDGVPDDFAYSLTTGKGNNNPVSISVSNYPIPITTQKVIDAGGTIDLELRISGAGGFDIEIYNAQMEINYAALTKNLF